MNEKLARLEVIDHDGETIIVFGNSISLMRVMRAFAESKEMHYEQEASSGSVSSVGRGLRQFDSDS